MASESVTHFVIPSASYTKTQNFDVPVNCRSLLVTFDITVASGGASTLTLSIRGKGITSGVYRNILTGNAENTVVTRTYRVSPHIAAAANADAADLVPPMINILIAVATAGANTYSVDVSECV